MEDVSASRQDLSWCNTSLVVHGQGGMFVCLGNECFDQLAARAVSALRHDVGVQGCDGREKKTMCASPPPMPASATSWRRGSQPAACCRGPQRRRQQRAEAKRSRAPPRRQRRGPPAGRLAAAAAARRPLPPGKAGRSCGSAWRPLVRQSTCTEVRAGRCLCWQNQLGPAEERPQTHVQRRGMRCVYLAIK